MNSIENYKSSCCLAPARYLCGEKLDIGSTTFVCCKCNQPCTPLYSEDNLKIINAKEPIRRFVMGLKRPVNPKFIINSEFWKQRKGGKFHRGKDFRCPKETPIYAVCDGYSYKTGWENNRNHKQGGGLRIWQNFYTEIPAINFDAFYCHLSKILIPERHKIYRGDLIGFSGNTGHSTGAHLHFGIRESGTNRYWNFECSTEKV